MFERAWGWNVAWTGDTQLAGRTGARSAAWLMAASAGWAALVVVQLLSLSRSTSLIDGVPIQSQWIIPWPIIAIAVLAGASSLAAAVRLRRGAIGPARAAMVVAAIAGVVGVLGAVAGIGSLWLTRRTR